MSAAARPRHARASTEAPFFVVGCPRSGTGLLRNLLNAHPRLSVPRESHFIPLFFRAYGHPRNEREALRLAVRILRFERVRSWGLDIPAESFRDARSFSDMVERLFGEWARRQGKPRWGDKTPQYVTQIPTLLELFPRAKVIHIFRDGRDAALSWLRSGYEPRNLYAAAREWRRRVRAGREAGSRCAAGAYLELRYEDLLERPEATLKAVCAFLGEEWQPAVLRPSPPPGVAPRFAVADAHERIVRENAGRWRAAMSELDRALFESAAGDLLDELGYETSATRRELSAAERLFFTAHDICSRRLSRIARPGAVPGPGLGEILRLQLRARLRALSSPG